MKAKTLACIAAASLSLAAAAPAFAASEYPLEPGEYVDMAMISIDDGHSLDYAKFLAASWKKQQEYAKSQGWITGYKILSNVDKRPGEPDLYLITRFMTAPDATEDKRRDEAFRAFMAKTDTQMEQETAQRATYRHQMGSMLLRKLEWSK